MDICFYYSLVCSCFLKEPMKQHIVLFFFALLLSSSLASARFIVDPKQGENEVKVNDKVVVQLTPDLKHDMQELMGSEKCLEKDAECFSRRMVEEAHLDYIYTQPGSPNALEDESINHGH